MISRLFVQKLAVQERHNQSLFDRLFVVPYRCIVDDFDQEKMRKHFLRVTGWPQRDLAFESSGELPPWKRPKWRALIKLIRRNPSPKTAT